ncbi:tryptophan-associated transmembrane protein [Microcella putealis]|uniref:Tryptophan-associated transmembrane protein n=1 Tax=Microcella putealis TaxID=337005 RepID=A0A4Q7LXQ0_9MICO|nr:Trp biosynthesis-associated membrane protein [Microcella putealis]RZS58819.1 tryptophan-associated transmembrane protein [Microcella putealis]TQM25038.1 tryptophan-associated transmembrane protein [Microcella putealis]
MTPARLRLLSLLGPLAAAGLSLLAWTQVWVTLTLDTGAVVEARGDVAASTVPALSLALLALTAALSLVGRTPRVVLAVVELALGVGIAAASLGVALAPVDRAAPAVTALTGIDGEGAVADLVVSSATSAWVWLALAGGVVAVIAGLFTALTTHRWPGRTRRYDTQDARGRVGEDRLGDWDALSDGDDPTAR